MRCDPRSVRCLPLLFSAKDGRPIRLELLGIADEDWLVQMYLDFRPRNSFQGLPPIKDEVCIKWVREMIRTGSSVIAREGRPVLGHCALFRIDDYRCELLVVVAPSAQNLGVGTQLTRCAVELADELGYRTIWLPVDATNVRARHVYKKCGFQYVSQDCGRELDMSLDLPQRRPGPRSIVPLPHCLRMCQPDLGSLDSLGSVATSVSFPEG